MYPFATAVGPRRDPGPYFLLPNDELQVVVGGADKADQAAAALTPAAAEGSTSMTINNTAGQHTMQMTANRAVTDRSAQVRKSSGDSARSDLFLEIFADRANFGCRQRALLDLQEVALALIAIVCRQFLDLVHYGVNASNRCLAPLGSLDQLGAERFDIFHRRIVFADDGFGGELADPIDAFLVLDVIGHRAFR
jgi:hypothetical protein